MALIQARSIKPFNGHAGVVRTTVKLTFFPSTSTSRIMLRVTKSFFKSGSSTLRNASITCSFVILIRKFKRVKLGNYDGRVDESAVICYKLYVIRHFPYELLNDTFKFSFFSLF